MSINAWQILPLGNAWHLGCGFFLHMKWNFQTFSVVTIPVLCWKEPRIPILVKSLIMFSCFAYCIINRQKKSSFVQMSNILIVKLQKIENVVMSFILWICFLFYFPLKLKQSCFGIQLPSIPRHPTSIFLLSMESWVQMCLSSSRPQLHLGCF